MTLKVTDNHYGRLF